MSFRGRKAVRVYFATHNATFAAVFRPLHIQSLIAFCSNSRMTGNWSGVQVRTWQRPIYTGINLQLDVSVDGIAKIALHRGNS
jgi:hypothetical protein